MRYEVREMAFGEILDTGFRLLRDHFVLLVGIAALLNVPISLAQAGVESAASGDPVTAGAASLAMGLLLIAASPIVGAAATFALGEVYLGREVSIGDALRKGLAIFVPLIGTSILAGIVAFGAFLLLIVPGIWVSLGLIILSQVMVLEGKFGTAALSRCFELMKGERLRAFGILLVVFLVQMVVGFGIGVALGAVPVVGALVGGIVASVTGAYTAAVSVVLYFDIRCRKEAFEVEQLARIVEAGTRSAAAS
jgi:hypothetical protein